MQDVLCQVHEPQDLLPRSTLQVNTMTTQYCFITIPHVLSNTSMLDRSLLCEDLAATLVDTMVSHLLLKPNPGSMQNQMLNFEISMFKALVEEIHSSRYG